jgi:predicted restriction endonuclease
MDNFLQEVQKIKVNRVGQLVSLHKPLLLLLTIGKVYNGHKNLFLFDEIEYELACLISKYGLKNTSRINPQYPFIYLASNSNLQSSNSSSSSSSNVDPSSS